jgi:hypothetical protein
LDLENKIRGLGQVLFFRQLCLDYIYRVLAVWLIGILALSARAASSSHHHQREEGRNSERDEQAWA